VAAQQLQLLQILTRLTSQLLRESENKGKGIAPTQQRRGRYQQLADLQ